jgi:hypothetical protein
MANFAKVDVLAACETYGRQLDVDPTLDGRGVMAAIASNESSLGADCGPRHEPTYDVGGALSHGKAQAMLLAKFGSAAACSYGPWQMMFDNFQTTNPDVLEKYLGICAFEFVTWFNKYVIGVRQAKTLAEIGEVWNLGHIGPDPAYVAKLEAAYDKWQHDAL